MNKLTKGAIAGAAGIALLLGGAGSFALWNASASVNAGTITSGTLNLTATTAGTWSNITNPSTPVDITSAVSANTFKMVPGNTLQYTQNLTVDATGSDLSATLSYSLGSGPRVVALGAYLSPVLAVTSNNANVAPNGSTGTYTVTPVAGTSTVTVTLTLTLPENLGDAAGHGLDGQGLSLDLNNITVTLQQNTPIS